MALVNHVLLNALDCGLDQTAVEAFLELADDPAKVANEGDHVGQVLRLGNEQAMMVIHVLQVSGHAFGRDLVAKQTLGWQELLRLWRAPFFILAPPTAVRVLVFHKVLRILAKRGSHKQENRGNRNSGSSAGAIGLDVPSET
jgi:hypothetical protein